MSQLVPCLGCSRHVRIDDLSCPFCGSTARASGPAPRRVAGLGRAALMALGASVAACGSGTSTTEVAGPNDPDPVVAPADPDAPSRPPSNDPPRDDIGAPAPMYGAAPDPVDPSLPPPEDDDGGNVALYGGPGLD